MANDKKKVLVIDDEEGLRKALKIKLTDEGYDVSVAADGKSGLEKALSDHPDLILLDVMMPKMTGQEVIAELQKDSWGKNVSVLFLTNVSDPIQVAQIGEQSVGNSTIFDYMVKSDWSLDDIAERVKQKLED